LQGKNPLFPQFPRLPLFKEILRILTKIRKVESKTKEFFLFFAETQYLRRFSDGKDTKKACKSEAIWED